MSYKSKRTFKGKLARKQLVPRNNFPSYPSKLRLTLTFSETWVNTTANPGLYDWVIRGNSPYDPDYALSTDSALGFDKWLALYTNYNVLKSRCTVEALSTTGVPAQYAIVHRRLPDSLTSMDATSAYPGAVVGFCTDQKPLKATATATTKDVLGVPPYDVGCLGSENSNPTHAWYWHVFSEPLVAGAAAAFIRVRVDYDVELTDPNGTLNQ